MPGGRPRKFTDPEAMQEVIDNYFNDLDDKIATMSGLAIELDMCTETLRTYRLNDEFSATVKRAKQRVALSWEQALIKGGAGPIFWLKNNDGWTDKITNENLNRDATGLSDQELADIAAGRS